MKNKGITIQIKPGEEGYDYMQFDMMDHNGVKYILVPETIYTFEQLKAYQQMYKERTI